MKMYGKGIKGELVDSPIFPKAFYCATKYSSYAFLEFLRLHGEKDFREEDKLQIY